MGNDWIQRLAARLDRDIKDMPRWSLVHSTRPDYSAGPSTSRTTKKSPRPKKKAVPRMASPRTS